MKTRFLYFLLLFTIACNSEDLVDDDWNRQQVSPPDWAPNYDYAEGARYFYLPDIQVYYDVFTHQFVYWNGASWIYAADLPYFYEPYDLYSGYVVVLNRGARTPWLYHRYYENHYPGGIYAPRKNLGSNVRNNVLYSRPRGFDENNRRIIYPENRSTHPTSHPQPSGTSPKPNETTQPREEGKPAEAHPQNEAPKEEHPQNQAPREAPKSREPR